MVSVKSTVMVVVGGAAPSVEVASASPCMISRAAAASSEGAMLSPVTLKLMAVMMEYGAAGGLWGIGGDGGGVAGGQVGGGEGNGDIGGADGEGGG